MSVYSYSGEKKFENVRNIGWLDERYDYRKGKVGSEAIEIIETMLKNLLLEVEAAVEVLLARGY